MMNLLFIFFISLSVLGNEVILGNQIFLSELDTYKNKNIALVVNQNSLVNNVHLIDVLLKNKLQIKKIFALEHGVRGNYSAGASVDDSIDTQTGLPIISLYGEKKKPSDKDLEGIDIIIYDIQDVGVRFYTFIASLGNIMESLNTKKVDLVILDRPNPNNYVAGPVNEFSNFLAPYPIPIVYGLTIAELALMIQGEKWRKVDKVNLKVIKMKNYKRTLKYEIKKNPSPNLRSTQSIINYPTLALFEATDLSLGRGTYQPFTIVGKPDYSLKEIDFTPISISGMAEKPKYLNKKCYGEKVQLKSFNFDFFYNIFKRENIKIKYDKFFKYLVGDQKTIELLLDNNQLDKIKSSWSNKLNRYINKRKEYLLYE